MNLFSIFDSRGYSLFLKGIPQQEYFDEGFNYLGGGWHISFMCINTCNFDAKEKYLASNSLKTLFMHLFAFITSSFPNSSIALRGQDIAYSATALPNFSFKYCAMLWSPFLANLLLIVFSTCHCDSQVL